MQTDILKFMLDELRGNRLEVIKVPGRDGGYIRRAITRNCEWYRRLCDNHKKPRKRYPRPRTIIKRCDTIRTLERMIAGNLGGLYAERLTHIAENVADTYPIRRK